MLYGVMVTYNDIPMVKRAIESIYDHVDQIIAVDGRFNDFPGDTDVSTDGTIEYLRSLDKVTLVVATGMDEIEKRNLYLVGDRNDWYLQLDADEEWTGDPPHPPDDADACIVPLHRDRPQHDMARVRLFRHVPGLHYKHKHYWLKDGQGRTFALLDKVGNAYKGVKIKGNEHSGSRIKHHDQERDGVRQSRKKTYYRKHLSPRERRIQEVL